MFRKRIQLFQLNSKHNDRHLLSIHYSHGSISDCVFPRYIQKTVKWDYGHKYSIEPHTDKNSLRKRKPG